MAENAATEFTMAETLSEVSFPNIQSVSNDEYALIRKNGLGATDASVYLGTMAKYEKTMDDVIRDKTTLEITDEDRAIGMKEAVRMGKDLEDLILSKFAGLHSCDKPLKPQHQYQIVGFPYLKVNYDGVLLEHALYVPVECKFVSLYGENNYDRFKAYEREFPTLDVQPKNPRKPREPVPTTYTPGDLVGMINVRAGKAGIPPYYYVQIQQQILGLESPYGYLAALHHKEWELCVYKVYRDDEVINKIKILGYQVWNKILAKLGKDSNALTEAGANHILSPDDY